MLSYMNFESLVGRINLIQDALQAQAAHAVNLSLTARNWLVDTISWNLSSMARIMPSMVTSCSKNLQKVLTERG